MWNKLQTMNKYDFQPFFFTVLRIGIGWHFFWEGWVKLAQPAWSAEGYLTGSWGPLAPLFRGMAALTVEETPILSWFATESTASVQWILAITNVMIPWLLLAAGLGLMLGLFTRLSIAVAMGLLALFIAAAPSFDYAPQMAHIEEVGWTAFYTDLTQASWAGKMMTGNEGSYFLINKNFIEFLALAAMLTINYKRLYGFDLLFPTEQEQTVPDSKPAVQTARLNAETQFVK